MNINKIFDKIPYGTFANFKAPHYIGMGAGLVIVICSLFYFLIISPNLDEMADLGKKIVEAQLKLQRYETKGARKEEITKEVATLFGTLLEKKRQLPLANEVPQLIQKISNIGDFLGLDIVAFKLDPAQEKGFYTSIPISVTISGNFYKTAGFFDSLQNLLRVVNVTSFKMDMQPAVKIVINEQGEAEKEEKDALQTEIKVYTYAYIEGSEEVKAGK